ncbi:13557_t:CDS:2 [Rhizophagus irregularis]|nr:13557_t:CDS:2 [Rhizophagus irregularis]
MKTLNNSTDEEKSKGSQLSIEKKWVELRTINYKEYQVYAQTMDMILRGCQCSIRIINIYMICNDKKIKHEIIVTVKQWIDEANVNKMDVVVMGDFNEHNNHQNGSDAEAIFLDMLTEMNLTDVHLQFNAHTCQKILDDRVQMLMELFTSRLMKWSHFLMKNGLTVDVEPLWYKVLSELTLNKEKGHMSELPKSKRKESKTYDEIGKHLIIDEASLDLNEKVNSPFLKDCKGSTMIEGRKIKNSGEEMMIKPFMTYENIDLQNDLVIEENINDYKEIEKNTMKIDSNVTDNIDIMWLNFVVKDEFTTEILENFISR